MNPRVLVELSPTLDTDEWARRYARGEVPDRVPYGLHRLADQGLSVLLRKPPRSWPVVQLSKAGARLTGGARWPEDLLGQPAPAAADARLFWDERSAIPALLRSGNKAQRRPVITGIIWNTERDANLSALARWTCRSALQRADAVYVNSAAQVPVLRAEWGVPSSRVHFVHFGVDTDFWDPALAGAASGLPGAGSGTPADERGRSLILSVGNDRHRDHQLLLAAVREVRAKLPRARLELVTATPQRIPPEAGHWRQRASHPELRDLYRQAAVVAICTRSNIHASGLTATLESMAMGKAVVVTRNPGLEDYITHGETGVFVPANDPGAMVGALTELLSDPGECARIGAAARRRVLPELSTQAMCQRLAGVIKTVI